MSSSAEQACLGSVLIQPDNAYILPTLQAEHFTSRQCRAVFRVMLQLHMGGDRVTTEAVQPELPLEYQPALATLMSRGHPSRVDKYARQVREDAIASESLKVCAQWPETLRKSASPGQALDALRAKLSALERKLGAEGRLARGERLALDGNARLEEFVKQGKPQGLSTGLGGLDRLILGLQPGRFYVVAGRPGMGKSALAMQTAGHLALRDGRRVLVFSLEMPKSELVDRMVCTWAQVNTELYVSGKVPEDKWGAISGVFGELAESGLTVMDADSLTMGDVRGIAQREAATNGLDMVIIDYLQLMKGSQQNRQEEISAVSRGCKALAKAVSCPVVGIAQLNRKCEERENKRPRLADLRESGSLEQDADVVLMLYRDEEYNPHSMDKGQAEVLVRKNRGGKSGTFCVLRYLSECVRFEDE